MANADTHGIREAGALSVIGAPFRAVFDVLVHLAEASPRMRAIQKYQAMSDDELAKRGMTRDSIVQHVFRDRFYA